MLHRIGCRALWALAILISVVMLLLSIPSHALAATPTCVTGAKGEKPTASLTFTAPTTNADSTPITGPLTYNLYQGTASGAEVKVATALAGSPINVTTGLADTTFYWYVTAVNAGGESVPSNEVCKSFPASPPGTMIITIN
jgi:hypothetical protein